MYKIKYQTDYNKPAPDETSGLLLAWLNRDFPGY